MRIFKRGKVYYCHVYEGSVRRQVSTRCHDKKAAEAVARQLERDAADPDHAAARTATLTEALNLLFRQRTELAKAGRRSKATVAFYKAKAGHWSRLLEHNVSGQYVAFPLRTLRARHIDAYISQRRAEGVSESTIHKELVTMRAALKLAKRAGLWRGDIAEILPVAFAPEYTPRTRALTRPELQRLLAQLVPDRAARVAFIVATSANWGESDRAQRVDADGIRVYIRGTKRVQRKRVVPIVTVEQRTLLAYALKYAGGTHGLLFAPWSNVRHDLEAACSRAGIERCSPNDLRRTCATWLRAAGAPNDLVAPVLGHADTRMVDRVYGRLSVDDLACRLATATVDSLELLVVRLALLGISALIELARRCSADASDSGDLARPAGLLGAKNPAILGESVPRDGIEPPTRGFSSPMAMWPKPRELPDYRRVRHRETAPVGQRLARG